MCDDEGVPLRFDAQVFERDTLFSTQFWAGSCMQPCREFVLDIVLQRYTLLAVGSCIFIRH
jgi:hypothetical protein